MSNTGVDVKFCICHHWCNMKDEVKIGVVGYSFPTKFNEVKARAFILDAYEKIQKIFPGKKIIIVSGLTNVGVPKIAYEEAVRLGWKTYGVACKKDAGYPLFPVDKEFIVGNNWGEESQTFVDMIDGIVRIGGGPQSLRETAVVKLAGKFVLEYDLPPGLS